MHAGKAAHTPASDHFTEPARRPAHKALSPSKGQIVNEISVEILVHIEVRVAAAFARPQLVADESIPAERRESRRAPQCTASGKSMVGLTSFMTAAPVP